MKLEYFKCQIYEELEGAEAYAKMAIEQKAVRPDWSKKLLQMSSDELQHAESLYTFFKECYKTIFESLAEIPEYAVKVDDSIDAYYVDMYAKVRTLHDIYKK